MTLQTTLANDNLKGLHLTLPVLGISESCVAIKINLNFYFHTSL